MSSPGGSGEVRLEDEPVVFVHDVLGAPGNPVRSSPGGTVSVALEDEPLTWFEVPVDTRTAPLSPPADTVTAGSGASTTGTPNSAPAQPTPARLPSAAPAGTRCGAPALRPGPAAAREPGRRESGSLAATGWSAPLWTLAALGAGLLGQRNRRAPASEDGAP